jgi:ubiquitin-conjugating enzyme E2 J2
MCPLEKNILEWRFVIKGCDKDYMGGYYHGKIKFPTTYPMSPPSILFMTPSGRFETNVRICMSISDYHPETWSPGWTVGTILSGIISFFNSEEITAGSIQNPSSIDRKKFASESMEYNLKDKIFMEVFGDNMVELFEKADAIIANNTSKRILDNKPVILTAKSISPPISPDKEDINENKEEIVKKKSKKKKKKKKKSNNLVKCDDDDDEDDGNNNSGDDKDGDYNIDNTDKDITSKSVFTTPYNSIDKELNLKCKI